MSINRSIYYKIFNNNNSNNNSNSNKNKYIIIKIYFILSFNIFKVEMIYNICLVTFHVIIHLKKIIFLKIYFLLEGVKKKKKRYKIFHLIYVLIRLYCIYIYYLFILNNLNCIYI